MRRQTMLRLAAARTFGLAAALWVLAIGAPTALAAGPTAPGSLTATAVSSTQISLSWTASTDTVAISAYLVQRCQGASCTTFAQVASVASGTTFLDASLTAATSYSYRVAAKDANAVVSAYSNTASATTQAASASGAVTYGYDALGRLVQATVPALSSVESYTYDASGNITAVTSTPLTKLAVTGASNLQGAPGTSITVFGSGFSTTLASDIVTINGIAATVTAATATQLTVTVPTGATAGPIAVKVGSTTVTGTQTFTPTSANAAPTITAVSPLTGLAGSTVTITGTGFSPTATLNRVQVNQTWATVTAATATSLTVVVPTHVGSGRVTVTTPGGTVTSNADLIVPPNAMATSLVVSAGRATLNGSSLPLTLSTGGKTTLVLFDATPGSPVSLALGAGTAGGAQLSVYAPDGSLLQGAVTITGSAQSIVLPTPALSGTYTVAIAPNGAGATLSLQVLGPATTALTVGAAATPVTLGTAGAPVMLTFAGTAGQAMTVALSSVTLSAATVTLVSPTGATLISQSLTTAGLTLYPTLPATGTYGVLIQPTGALTGSLNASVAVTPIVSSLTVNQASATLPIASATPQVLSFTGTSGQYLSVAVAEATGSVASAMVSVLQPGGVPLASGTLTATCSTSCAGSTVVNLGPLAQAGTYLVVVQSPAGGSASLQVTLAAPVSLALGAATSGSIPVTLPGQGVLVTFSVNAAQPFVFTGTGITGLSAPLIFDPAGTPVPPTDTVLPVAPANYGPVQSGGTYSALMTQASALTGTVSVTTAGAATATLAVPGQANVAVASGQPATLSFSATAGQYFSVAMSETAGLSPAAHVTGGILSVAAPNGQLLAAQSFTPSQIVCYAQPCTTPPTYVCTYCPPNFGQWVGSMSLNFGPVPSTGTYTIVFQQPDAGSGPLAFGLATTAIGTAALGSSVAITVPTGDSGVVATFPATAGQTISVATSSGTVQVIAPNGAILQSTASSSVVANLISIPLTGTYTIVDPTTSGSSATLTVATPATGTLVLGTPLTVPLVLPGQAAQVTFSGTAGQLVTLASSATGSVGAIQYVVLNPDGSTLVPATAVPPVIPPLPANGTYTLLVAQQAAGVGSVTLTLAAANGITSAQTWNLTTTVAGQAATDTFTVAADQNLSLVLSGLSFTGGVTQALVAITNSAGGTITSTYCYATGPCDVILPQLTAPGIYTMTVTPQGSGTMTGSATLAPNLRGMLVAGTPLPVSFGSAGQNGAWTFTASAGQTFVLDVGSVVTSPANGTYYVSLTGPGGTSVATGSATTGSDLLLNLPNLAAGIYTVAISTSVPQTGSLTLTLKSGLTATLAATGAPANFSTTVPGQNGYFTFAATRGQNFSLALTSLVMTPSTVGGVTVTIAGPAGTTIATGSCGTAGCVIGPFASPGDGLCSVLIQPQGTATMSFAAGLTPAVTGALVAGTATTVNLTQPAQGAVYTFPITAPQGQTVGLTLSTPSTTPATNTYSVTVLNENQTTTAGQTTITQPTVLTLPNLAPGTYEVLVSPSVPATGSVSVLLTNAATGTLTLGTTSSVPLTQSGQSASLNFTLASSTLPYVLTITGSGLAPATGTYAMTLIGPGGTTVASGSVGTGSTVFNLENTGAGTYTLNLVPATPQTGTFQVLVGNGVDTALPASGATTSVATTILNENATLTFSATAGQNVSLALSNASVSPSGINSLTLQVLNPDGTTYNNLSCQIPSCELRLLNLPQTGTYTVIVQPGNPVTMSFSAAASVDLAAALVIGTTKTLSLADLGQSASLSFTLPTANTAYALTFTTSTIATGSYYSLNLYGPGGTFVTSGTINNGTTTFNLENLAAGAYTATLVPAVPTTSSLQVLLSNGIVDPLPGTGTTVVVTTAQAGENASLTFSATAGQNVSLAMTGVSVTPAGITSLTLQILNPDGTTYNNLSCQLPSCEVRLLRLPQTGTYTVIVEPFNPVTMSFTASAIADLTGTLTAGTTTTVTLGAVGQSAIYTYASATAGQLLVLDLPATTITPTGANYAVNVTDPTGALAASLNVASGATVLALPTTLVGTYTISIVPTVPASGSIKLLLTPAPVVAVPTTGVGTAVSTTIAGENTNLTFSGTANQSLTLALSGIVLTPSGASYLTLQITNPNGTTFGTQTCQLPGCVVRLANLPQSGTYSIAVSPNSQATQSYTATLSADFTANATAGNTIPVSLTSVGQSATLSVTATAGQTLTFTFSGLTTVPAGDNYSIWVYDPNHSFILSNSLVSGSSTTQPITNAIAGVYTLVIIPISPSTATFSAVYH